MVSCLYIRTRQAFERSLQRLQPVNQIETHPFNQQIETQKFLQNNSVQIESWVPGAEGRNNIFDNELLRSIAGTLFHQIEAQSAQFLRKTGISSAEIEENPPVRMSRRRSV